MEISFNAEDILKYFTYFSQKEGFYISCKFFPQEITCMKYQGIFSEKNTKIIFQFVDCRISSESGKG